jgi:carboxymethylenebutenolidase
MALHKDNPSSKLPTPKPVELAAGLTLLHPLSRRGCGPGLIVLTSGRIPSGVRLEGGVPSPLMKWAEEGYTVVEVHGDTFDKAALSLALTGLARCESCQPKEKVGLLGEE